MIDAAGSGALGGLAARSAAARPGHARRSSRPATICGPPPKTGRPTPRFPTAQADPPVGLPERLQRTCERHEPSWRWCGGRIEHVGPTTAAEIAEFPRIAGSRSWLPRSKRSKAKGSCCAATSRGRPGAANGHPAAAVVRPAAAGPHSSADARPDCGSRFGRSSRDHFCTFSLVIISCLPDDQWGGAVGVRRRSHNCKASNCRPAPGSTRAGGPDCEYDPAWLDNLFLSGEVVWGRLTAPRRDEADGPTWRRCRAWCRFRCCSRELPLLLPPPAADTPPPFRSLRRGSARSACRPRRACSSANWNRPQLLPGHLEEALRELAALGLITSDAFAAVRTLVEAQAPRPRRRATAPFTA